MHPKRRMFVHARLRLSLSLFFSLYITFQRFIRVLYLADGDMLYGEHIAAPDVIVRGGKSHATRSPQPATKKNGRKALNGIDNRAIELDEIKVSEMTRYKYNWRAIGTRKYL